MCKSIDDFNIEQRKEASAKAYALWASVMGQRQAASEIRHWWWTCIINRHVQIAHLMLAMAARIAFGVLTMVNQRLSWPVGIIFGLHAWSADVGHGLPTLLCPAYNGKLMSDMGCLHHLQSS